MYNARFGLLPVGVSDSVSSSYTGLVFSGFVFSMEFLVRYFF